MKKVKIAVLLLLLTNIQNVVAQCNILIDDFSSAVKQSGQVVSMSRYWYSFGGVNLDVGNNNNRGLLITGNINGSGGFGIAPDLGTSGAPIVTSNCDSIQIVISGPTSSLKLELYDRDNKMHEIWISLNSNTNTYTVSLPPDLRRTNITKLQFVLSFGKYNLRLESIMFK